MTPVPHCCITASSYDGSILAVTSSLPSSSVPGSTSVAAVTSSVCRIRCYDAKTTLGSLKFTLVDRTHHHQDDDNDDNNEDSGLTLTRLAFVPPPLLPVSTPPSPPEYLVSCFCSQSSTISSSSGFIHVWDLNRGVIAHRISPPSNHILCDIATTPATTVTAGGAYVHGENVSGESNIRNGDVGRGANKVYALFVRNRTDDNDNKKCIVNEYDAQSGRILRKIKAGSSSSSSLASGGNSGHRLALSPDASMAAVQLGERIRIINLVSGERVHKLVVAVVTTESDAMSNIVALSFSDDSKCILAAAKSGGGCATSSWGEYLVHTYRIPNKDDKNDVAGGRPIMSCLVDSAPIHVQKNKNAVIVTCKSGSVSFFDTAGASSKRLLEKQASSLPHVVKASGRVVLLDGTTDTVDKIPLSGVSLKLNAIRAEFRSSVADDKFVLVRQEMRFGAWQPFFSTHTYKTRGGQRILSQIVVPSFHSEKGSGPSGKRGAAVLGPGEGGNEAVGVVDVQHKQHQHRELKKSKIDRSNGETTEEFLVEEEEEDGVGGAEVVTIAERLKALSDKLAREDDDDENDVVEGLGMEKEVTSLSGKNSISSNVITPGTGSLAIVVKQALRSSDDSQLEVALSCPDVSVVKSTIAEMEDDGDVRPDEILLLLTKLVHRIAKKPNRAAWLGGVWIRTILSVYSSSLLSGSGDGYDGGGGEFEDSDGRRAMIARILGPLKNLLSERTEAFPHLLKLEGRLCLLSGDYDHPPRAGLE